MLLRRAGKTKRRWTRCEPREQQLVDLAIGVALQEHGVAVGIPWNGAVTNCVAVLRPSTEKYVSLWLSFTSSARCSGTPASSKATSPR